MIISEFRPLTSGIMFEYRTDSSKIMQAAGAPANGDATKFFMYQGLDGAQYMVEYDNFKNTLFPDDVQADCYYPGMNGYGKLAYRQVSANYNDKILGDIVGFNRLEKLSEHTDNYRTVFKKVGTIIKSDDYDNIVSNSTLIAFKTLTKDEALHGWRSALLYHDSIRIYLATGYVMNALAGLHIKVWVPIRNLLYFDENEELNTQDAYNEQSRNANGKLVLLNWYLPKEMLKETDTLGNPLINWIASPLYMNSRFYDRYIEIKLPSPRNLWVNNETLYIKPELQDLAKKLGTKPDTNCYENRLYAFKQYIKNTGIDYVYSREDINNEIVYYHGTPNKNTVINVDISTVSNDYMNFYDTDGDNYYECSFNLDSPRLIALSSTTATKYLNAQIYEDNNNSIVYQPVWGDPTVTNNLSPMDIPMMLLIETGVIPMIDYADYDSLNDGIDDFIENYGEDVYKWIIINELSASYYYRYIIDPDNDANSEIEPYTEYYTNTIDYTGKTEAHGEFWKSYFIPHIQQRSNMVCDYIAIKYTVHLYNRMNNIDIVKTSSAIIDEPTKYQSRPINTANINNIKLVNQIVKQSSGFDKVSTTAKTPETITRNIRSYYSNMDILVKMNESNVILQQGEIVLRLYRKAHNYRFYIQVLLNDNSRIPYDMSGLQEYKLSFPVLNTAGTAIAATSLDIFPVTSSIDTNFGAGALMFYINEQQVKQIMAVPNSERIFALMTYNPGGQDESVIFEGTVQYMTS